MVRDNVIAFEQGTGPARRRISDAKTVEIVAGCRQVLADTLPRLTQDLFERLDDELYALADKSQNDVLQTAYFEAMRELRKLRNSIEQGYVRTQLAAYDDFWNGKHAAAGHGDEDSELELVDEDELEENLAIGGMVSKAENRFHRELFALNMRFAQLASTSEISDDQNPVAPASLVTGFQRALELWRGELAVRLVIFKLFDRFVMSYIGGLYDDVNDKLVAAGILPKIVQRVRRNPVAPSVERARSQDSGSAMQRGQEGQPGSGAGQGGGSQGAAAQNVAILSMLSDLLAVNRRSGNLGPLGNSVANYANVNLPEISSNDLVGALSNLQQQQTSMGYAPSMDEVQRFQGEMVMSLGRQLDMGDLDQPSKRFARGDQDIIDVIGMLFEFILDDRNVPDAMKALLGRLQIPMLKVAVIDRGFFGNPSHPARRLLNNLARAAMTWVDDGDRSEQSLYGRIESVVTRILVDFVDDVALFESLGAEFAAFMERENRSSEVAEERISQVSRGQEQLQLARKTVSDVLDDFMGRAPELPDPVARLLSEGWRDVMLLAYLREGNQSRAWKDACDMVERLIWSVQPKREQDDRQALLKAIPEMLKELRDSLVNISFDQHRAATLFKELQACHIAALRGDHTASPADRKPGPPVLLTEDAEEREVAAAPQFDEAQLHDECFQAASALDVGQWFEWGQEDGTQMRGKLSWRSEVTGKCIFVSRKGMKIAELPVCEIADLMRDDRGRVIGDVNTPFMDKALNAMLKVLGDGVDPEHQPG